MPISPDTPVMDTHCHLTADDFDADRDEVITRMKAAGTMAAIVIGCDDDDYPKVLQLTQQYPGTLWGAWGLHPEYENVPEVSLETIVERCSAPGIVAVGETGLDFYWCKEPLDWQRARFRRHIEAARILKKPLVIHARDSETEALAILREEHAGDMGFVMHCFSGTERDAKEAVDLGGCVSFTGSLTFKRNDALRAVCGALPLTSIMLETDSPYMAPVPMRGKRCEPTFIPHIANVVATIHGVTPEEVARTTTQTAIRFFGLPLTYPAALAL